MEENKCKQAKVTSEYGTEYTYPWRPDVFKLNFIAVVVRKYLDKNPTVSHGDIYRRVGMSKTAYNNTISIDRAVSPKSWQKFRKAIRMSKGEFWKLAQEFYDKKE